MLQGPSWPHASAESSPPLFFLSGTHVFPFFSYWLSHSATAVVFTFFVVVLGRCRRKIFRGDWFFILLELSSQVLWLGTCPLAVPLSTAYPSPKSLIWSSSPFSLFFFLLSHYIGGPHLHCWDQWIPGPEALLIRKQNQVQFRARNLLTKLGFDPFPAPY